MRKREKMKQRLAAIVRRPEGAEGDWFRLVENGPEYNTRKRHLRRRFTGQRDAIALCDHRHQRVPFNVKALNARLAPVLGEAEHDMIMYLWCEYPATVVAAPSLIPRRSHLYIALFIGGYGCESAIRC